MIASMGMVIESTYQTRPNAPMPTGWRSEYLEMKSATEKKARAGQQRAATDARGWAQAIPRGDLECGTKDLGTDELGHGEGGVEESMGEGARGSRARWRESARAEKRNTSLAVDRSTALEGMK